MKSFTLVRHIYNDQRPCRWYVDGKRVSPKYVNDLQVFVTRQDSFASFKTPKGWKHCSVIYVTK